MYMIFANCNKAFEIIKIIMYSMFYKTKNLRNMRESNQRNIQYTCDTVLLTNI